VEKWLLLERSCVAVNVVHVWCPVQRMKVDYLTFLLLSYILSITAYLLYACATNTKTQLSHVLQMDHLMFGGCLWDLWGLTPSGPLVLLHGISAIQHCDNSVWLCQWKIAKFSLL